MAPTERQAQEARRVFAKSGGRTEQRDTGYLLERKRIQKANDEKTARLKALRLAKEAAERLEAASNPINMKKRRLKKAPITDAAPT